MKLISKIIISSALLCHVIAAHSWEFISESPITVRADDISRTLPAYFVCDVDERIRVYQNNVEVTEKVISLNSYKTINNLYSIFYENHDSIEINGYKYIVAGASEVEFVMRHCNE